MQAVILAATGSKRLFPLAEIRPACLLPVGGKPLLEWNLEALQQMGVREVCVVVNHHAELVRRFLQERDNGAMHIECITQSTTDSVGNALMLCADHIKEDFFFLVYGDVWFSGQPFRVLLERHMETGHSVVGMTLLSHSAGYGNIYVGDNMRVTRFLEKPTEDRLSNHVFAGMALFTKADLAVLEEQQEDIINCFQELSKQGRLLSTSWNGAWRDIRYPWDLLEANQLLMRQWRYSMIDSSITLPSHITLEGPIRMEAGAQLEAGCVIKGPCYIGAGAYVGNHALLRPYTVLGENVLVGHSTELKNCMVLAQAKIGSFSYVADSVVGASAELGVGTITLNVPEQAFLQSLERPAAMEKMGSFIGDGAKLEMGQHLTPGMKIAPEV